jgi:hypothetical protein
MARFNGTAASLLAAALLGGAGVAAALVISGSAAALPDPLTCAGYPEQRIFLESQSGWANSVLPYGQAEHAHSGTCFPYNKVLSGTVTLDVVSKMHNVPGWQLEFVRVQLASDQAGVQNAVILAPKQACYVDDCTFTTPISFDSSLYPAGRYEFRVHTEIRKIRVSDGLGKYPRSLATNGWQACLHSCSGYTPQAVDFPEGRGWYDLSSASGDTFGYENARLLSDPPTAPVSGEWCPELRTLGGAGGQPVVSSFVSVDPAFHAVPEDPGLVVLEQAGPIEGPVCIDTTLLANGPHKLFIRAEADEPASAKLWGVLVVPFEVAN